MTYERDHLLLFAEIVMMMQRVSIKHMACYCVWMMSSVSAMNTSRCYRKGRTGVWGNSSCQQHGPLTYASAASRRASALSRSTSVMASLRAAYTTPMTIVINTVEKYMDEKIIRLKPKDIHIKVKERTEIVR